MLLMFTSCSKAANDNNNENNTNNNEKPTEENNDTNKENNDSNTNGDSNDENVDHRTDQGNLEIWYEAEVTLDEDKVTVEGESNLIPGAEISSSGVSDHWPVDDFYEEAEIKEDGTFSFEFPNYETEVEVTLKLSTIRDSTAEHYGENLENATGNQVNLTDTPGEYQSAYTFIVDPRKERPYTIDLTTPDWEDNIPSDYGDTDIWMEVESTTEHNYLYFEGKSNLVEGSQIKGDISDPDDLISSAWSSSSARVKPDGSFQLHIHYWDLKDGMEMNFQFDPDQDSWENVIDTYGENGEDLTGDLVQRKDNDEKYIKHSIDLAGPEFSAPDNVDLTMADEEIKLQVPDDLLFDFDKSTLKTEAQEILDEIIDDLSDYSSDFNMQINGHTDSQGESDYNLTLSEERAHAVADYINDNSNLDSLSMDVQGFGETKPIASNENDDERQKNRRVEIVINPN